MCAIVEEALANAGILTPGAKSPSVARDARASLLSETLELLNQLPFRGFPDEHQVRVPVFSLQAGAVMARTSPLRKLPGNFRIRSELRSVRQGGTYKMPYWPGSASGAEACPARRRAAIGSALCGDSGCQY